jgi:hypothetical protein
MDDAINTCSYVSTSEYDFAHADADAFIVKADEKTDPDITDDEVIKILLDTWLHHGGSGLDHLHALVKRIKDRSIE